MTTSDLAAPTGNGFAGVWRRLRSFDLGDSVAHGVTLLAGAGIFILVGVLLVELWLNSRLARHQFGWNFLVTSVWDPIAQHFGALPFLYGTLVTSFLALIIAIPLGLGTAIFLVELVPAWLSDWLAFIIDLLAAVPSVVYGLLGIFILVPVIRSTVEPFLHSTLGFLPLFQGPAYGFGFLAAGVILGIMVVPFIVSVSREVLLAVPQEQREAALSLGATQWEAASQVVVPYARSGIFGSIFLALARALGETMAVTMVIGNDPTIHKSLFASGYSIAAVIANEFAEATSTLYIHVLIELGLILFGLTFVLNALARLLILATVRRGTVHP